MRIAQLTDLHLLNLEHRSQRGTLRRRLVSYARPLDAEDRYLRMQRQLRLAAGCDHLVLTGDLTEDGSAQQFEVLAELLHASTFKPEQVTLLPGNHDRYSDARTFGEALQGPLRGFNTQPIDVGGTTIIPVDTTIYQHFFFSRGRVAVQHWRDVLALTQERVRAGQTVVLAQHHPATKHFLWPMQLLDGNRDYRMMRALLEATEHTYVIHGHVHDARAHVLLGRDRIFSASAVVDSDAPLRVYELRDGALVDAAPALEQLAA